MPVHQSGRIILCMNSAQQEPAEDESLKRASRVQSILYGLMFLLIALPFLVIWLTGAFSF